MNILVTGGTGFIGRHVVQALLKAGHRVDLLSRGAIPMSPGASPDRFRIHVGDFASDDLDHRLPHDCEAIYHLAAMSSVTQCLEQPKECLQVNVLGTQNLLAAARRRSIRRFILVSSVYVYGDVERFPTSEDVALMPTSPLGASKIAAESLARAYAISYDLPVTIFRPFTVYGPGSGRHQLIPSLIDEILSTAPSLNLGDPDATRDFVHVTDVVDGLQRGLQDTGAFHVYNLGTGVETSIRRLGDLLLDLCGVPDKPVQYGQRAPRADERHRTSRQCADISRASGELGWRPRVGLQEGLRDLVERMKAGVPPASELVQR